MLGSLVRRPVKSRWPAAPVGPRAGGGLGRWAGPVGRWWAGPTGWAGGPAVGCAAPGPARWGSSRARGGAGRPLAEARDDPLTGRTDEVSASSQSRGSGLTARKTLGFAGRPDRRPAPPRHGSPTTGFTGAAPAPTSPYRIVHLPPFAPVRPPHERSQRMAASNRPRPMGERSADGGRGTAVRPDLSGAAASRTTIARVDRLPRRRKVLAVSFRVGGPARRTARRAADRAGAAPGPGYPGAAGTGARLRTPPSAEAPAPAPADLAGFRCPYRVRSGPLSRRQTLCGTSSPRGEPPPWVGGLSQDSSVESWSSCRTAFCWS